MMRKTKKGIVALLIASILSTQLTLTPITYAQIPLEYKPNYKFNSERAKSQEILVKIRSLRKQNQAIETFYFSNLLKNFKVVFPYLPTSPDNNQVFEDCRLGAETLSTEYDPNQFSLFSNNCLSPLEEIFKTIANNGTVNAKIIASPNAGSAPLTVTFDGRWSADTASNTTVPSNNYFWYYTDEKGVEQAIWRGPVVKQTFKKEGNYVVHLTVRSAHNEDKWVFDGEASANINVGPQAANIVISTNGKRLREEIPTKFTSAEASEGLRIDGWSTTPLGGRQIMKHVWKVTNGSQETMYENGGNWSPSSFRLKLGANGVYIVTLAVLDNENNTVEKSFEVVIADPIATIKVSPQDGTTTSIYNFDASTSYSVQSSLKAYQWTITDADGDVVVTEKVKTFQHKFTKPGTYRVKLRVLDQLGNDNEEAMTLEVGSTPPVPQFTVEPTKQWKYPSQFTLDASPSYDIDTTKGDDALTYERAFSNSDNVVIDQTYDNGKRIDISMKEKGNYKATLTVKDNYGKIEQTSKDIVVESSLRPYIFVSPVSTQYGNSTTFIAKTNKPVVNYDWSFGDGTTRKTQSDKMVTTYKKVGTYKVSALVTTADGDSNEVITQAFVGEANSPIPAYAVTNERNETTIPEGTCTDPTGTSYPAYIVRRMQSVMINAQESVNIAGGKENLMFYYKAQGSNAVKKQQLSIRFEEVGCRFVDLTIEDTAANKTASSRIRFQVSNAKPVLQNVIMTFPQVSKSYGIGIGQTANKDLLNDSTLSTLAIRIDAVNAVDSDGSIAKYKWFYYNVEDPERILEIKYTPANVPYVFFALDRSPGEYRFGVEVFDNDGESTMSESILGKGPVIFFPASADNVDTPIVTLKVDNISPKVGEQVRLEVISKTTSNRPDYAKSRVISYDFDGDGVFDATTKDNVYTYVYKQTGSFTPRVKVTYRGRPWYANGEKIIVEKGIKADFLYALVGNTLLVRDTSYGDITSRAFCTDALACRTNPAAIIENQTYFQKEYVKPGKYVLDYKIQDAYGNASSKRGVVDVLDVAPTDALAFVTLPSADEKWVVNIGKALDNKVLFYAQFKWGDCYIDTDIARDSKNEWKPDQNRDIECNQQALYEYTNSRVGSTIARVYYSNGTSTTHKDVTIQFLDNNIELTATAQTLYEKIETILASLGDSLPDVKTSLLQLRNAIVEGDTTSAYVLQLREVVEAQKQYIDPATLQSIDDLIIALSDNVVVSSIGGNEYEKSRSVILDFIPTARKAEVAKIFEEIDNANGDKTTIKNQLLKIFDIITEEYDAKRIGDEEKEGLESEVCSIVIYYEIPDTACKLPDEGSGSVITEPSNSSSGGSTAGKILKIVGIIVGIIAVGFIILVVIFAIKAKRKQNVEG